MALVLQVRDKDGNYIPIPYLQGLSAYDVYKQSLPVDEYPLSEAEWIASLRAGSVYEAYVETLPEGETPKTEAEFYAALITSTTLVTAFEQDTLNLQNGGTGANLTDIKQLRPLIEAAPLVHTHTPAETGSAPSEHSHVLSELPFSYGTSNPSTSTPGVVYFKI